MGFILATALIEAHPHHSDNNGKAAYRVRSRVFHITEEQHCLIFQSPKQPKKIESRTLAHKK